METKHPLKSKTIESAIIIIVVALLNLLNIGNDRPGQTYDTMLDEQNRQGEQIKNLFLLGGGAGAIYGRAKANTKIGRKKNED